jgi:S-DNA-T family DNA segregation ATPase FtsK/SpoIIIE
MAKKKHHKQEKNDQQDLRGGFFDGITEEVRHASLSLLFLTLSIFFILSKSYAGPVGAKIYEWFHNGLFGVGYYILPILFLLLSISYFKGSRPKFPALTVLVSFCFFISTLGLISLVGADGTGGFVGDHIKGPMNAMVGSIMSFIFLLAFCMVSLLFMFNTRPSREAFLFWKRFMRRSDKELAYEESLLESSPIAEKSIAKIEEAAEKIVAAEKILEEKIKEEPVEKKEKTSLKEMLNIGKTKSQNFADTHVGDRPFVPPPLSILSKDKGKPEVGDIKANTNIIKRTLQNFGVMVEMDEVSVGPSITRYALKPAEGVKLSRIVGLQNDLSLALAAHPIRIEAPIPGKSLVGIEIPNTIKTTVGLGSLLAESEYQESDKPLLVAVGKAISGKAFFGNLAKMPHLLIAGTTGSGKSVTVHAMINSLLFRNPPENLKFILVDPKRVEMTLYNGIPHLLTPVITDPKKTIKALRWAGKEMERRYDILETEKVQNIASYHKTVYAPAIKKYLADQAKQKESGETTELEDHKTTPKLPERLPYIVIVIDELADIMTAYPRELESAIVRLAQMSRAVGIHLILSTQRPSVNVITGLIKANIPARAALQVSSQIDSRTILDTGGAEKLLGAGDMLFLSGDMSKPVRVQSAYISESEIKTVVKHITDAYRDMLPDMIDMSAPQENSTDVIFSSAVEDEEDEKGGKLDDDMDDDLYEDARKVVITTRQASTSYLQRKLGVGYSRAAKLIDVLEERGVIGPKNGSKQREIYEKVAGSDNYTEGEQKENSLNDL